jgi:hypothetical protein
MGSLFRVSLALCCLCPAWGLLKVAHWICPELKAPEVSTKGQWLDAPYGWDRRPH